MSHRTDAAGRPEPEVAEPRPGPLLGWIDGLLGPLPEATVERGSVVAVLALGILDASIGATLLLTPVYLLPIGATTWYGPRRSGRFLSALAAAVGLAARALPASATAGGWAAVWNAGMELTLFLTVASLVAWLRRAKAVQRQLAHSDPLTGLANTRAFFDRLHDEIDRGLRYGRVFTLAYLDLDRFKEVNDTLGHAEGDEVLLRVAEILHRVLRANDLPARLGGDEFGIVLPETPYARAERTLERLRSEILAGMRDEGWPVTLSIGAVTFESAVETPDDAVRIADGLMYAAKNAGGDGIQHLLWTGE